MKQQERINKTQMKFSSKNQYPLLLSCNICFCPPHKPRISVCVCNLLFCYSCAKNYIQEMWCPQCQWKFDFQQLPETYKYMLENIQIKCQICQEYQPALKYKKHEIKCNKMKELSNNQYSIQQFIQFCQVSNIKDVQKIRNQPLKLSEMDLIELSKIHFTCYQCFQQFDGINQLSHIQLCQEKQVLCEMENCEWMGNRRNYNIHLKSCCENQINKRETEIKQLEQASFILSRNECLNSSEAEVMERQVILLRELNFYNEQLVSTPLRDSYQHLIQSFIYTINYQD